MIINTELAVIIGSGTGGLVAAAALSPIFDRVIVLEKDTLPDSPRPRKSVPQGAHLHSLLLGGLNILEIFYPGIANTLLNNDAATLRAGLDQQIHESGEWLPQRDLGFVILAQSRPLLEFTLLNQTSAIQNVELRQKARVQELVVNDLGDISGLNYVDENENLVFLPCETVVDASGLGGFFVKQLSKRFPDMEKSDEIESNIAYASAFLKKPSSFLNTKENILIIPEPTHSAGGALIDIENNQWCVSIHGRNGLIPPTDFEEWKGFIKNQLPDPRIWERVKNSELIGDIKTFRKPKSTWRRFDQAAQIAGGYFPLGDTISSVNPIFGQGMTVAFGHALSLREAFHEQPLDPQKLYLQKAASWSQRAWRRVLAYDSTFAKSDDKQPRNYAIMRKLALARQLKAHQDPSVHEEIVKQGQMLI